MKPLDKTELRRRLEREGRWKAFVGAREVLVKERGLSRAEAWDVAFKDFAKPLEAIEPSLLEKRVEREKVKSERRDERVRERLDGDKISDEPRPELDGEKWVDLALDYRRDMDFVCRNLWVKAPRYDKAPSAWAAGLLWRVRTSRQAQADFVKEALGKLTPGKTELERAAGAAVEHVEALEKLSRRVRNGGTGKGVPARPMTLAEVRSVSGLGNQGLNGENLAMVGGTPPEEEVEEVSSHGS